MAADHLNQLTITLDGPGIGEYGVAVDDLAVALEGVQGALRLMVEHLGGRQPGPGRPPRWVRDQSTLRLTSTSTSSFAATLSLGRPPDGQAHLEDLGPQAIDALLNWDGCEDSTLPSTVTDKLYEMPAELPEGARLWLGSIDGRRRVEVRRTERGAATERTAEAALLRGWLKEVNWDKLTAQLHDSTGGFVRLRFDPELNEEMLRLATRYVEIRGDGRFNPNDEWTSVHVERIDGTRSGREPFDLESVLKDPNPKVFDPEHVITASEPFDVDEFVRVIHEGRDVGRE